MKTTKFVLCKILPQPVLVSCEKCVKECWGICVCIHDLCMRVFRLVCVCVCVCVCVNSMRVVLHNCMNVWVCAYVFASWNFFYSSAKVKVQWVIEAGWSSVSSIPYLLTVFFTVYDNLISWLLSEGAVDLCGFLITAVCLCLQWGGWVESCVFIPVCFLESCLKVSVFAAQSCKKSAHVILSRFFFFFLFF